MGGVAKGLLRCEDRSLLERVVESIDSFDPALPIVLVGHHSAYRNGLGSALPMLRDSPQGVGPIGGIVALARFAVQIGRSKIFVLACDHPYISALTLAKLRAKGDGAHAIGFAQNKWQPFVSLLWVDDVARATENSLARCRYSLRSMLQDFERPVRRVAITAMEATDWDTPEDISRAANPSDSRT
jgi:molybdopterin-guanine dinucleotide biosynthesis protein A